MKRLCVLAMAAVLLLCAFTTNAQESTTSHVDEKDYELRGAKVTGTNVNVRSAPNTQGRVLFQIKNPDEEFLIIHKDSIKDSSGQDWYRIIYRWVEASETFRTVEAPSYIIGRFLQIELIPADIIESYGLDFFWARDREDILNPKPQPQQQPPQQTRTQQNTTRRQDGIYPIPAIYNPITHRGRPVKTSSGTLYHAPMELIRERGSSIYVNIVNPERIMPGRTGRIQIISSKDGRGNYNTYTVNEDGSTIRRGGRVYTVVDARVIN